MRDHIISGVALRQESMFRQVALVSYGTQFLRHACALEDWSRHAVFRDARSQFRSLAGNVLLADDFTQWLDQLRRSGAQRLSLHVAAELALALPAAINAAYAMVVDFADRYQVWAFGEERMAWAEEIFLPGAAGYRAALDSYWLAEERPGQLAVAETNWQKLAAAIAADLEINVPSSQAQQSRFFLPAMDDACWVRLPLFPSAQRRSLAHHIVARLYREQAEFANAANPKNEDSDYRRLSDAEAAKADDWRRRLDSWMTEVLLRCANDIGGTEKETPLTRLLSPPPSPPIHATMASATGEPPQKVAASKWISGLGLLVAIVVLSLFVMAIAHIVARFPWLAVLIALPWALYVKYTKE